MGVFVNSGWVGSIDYFVVLDDFNIDMFVVFELVVEWVELNFGGVLVQLIGMDGNFNKVVVVELVIEQLVSFCVGFVGGVDVLRLFGYLDNSDLV